MVVPQLDPHDNQHRWGRLVTRRYGMSALMQGHWVPLLLGGVHPSPTVSLSKVLSSCSQWDNFQCLVLLYVLQHFVYCALAVNEGNLLWHHSPIIGWLAEAPGPSMLQLSSPIFVECLSTWTVAEVCQDFSNEFDTFGNGKHPWHSINIMALVTLILVMLVQFLDYLTLMSEHTREMGCVQEWWPYR